MGTETNPLWVGRTSPKREKPMLKTTCRRPANQLRQIVAEGLAPEEPAPAVTTQGNTTFRIAITSQVYENYGAHCWDGTGECPQYWKAKGGNEYQRNIGTATDVIQLGSKGIARIIDEMRAKFETLNDSWHEYMISWAVVPTTEETYYETDLREMLQWGIITQEQHDEYHRQVAI